MSRALGFFFFLLVAIAILGASHYYLWARLVRDPAWPAPYRQLAGSGIALLAMSVPGVFILGRALAALPRGAYFAVFSWLGVMFLLLVLTAAANAMERRARQCQLSTLKRVVRKGDPTKKN